MFNDRKFSSLVAWCVACALLFAPHTFVFTQTAVVAKTEEACDANATTINDQTALAAIEKTIEAKRREYNIPGVSLAIVRDDKIIYAKGLGYKDFERKLPVTADTLFAIGSSTKAFTAMAAMMSQDAGKLSLDDSPKKFLPYFKLQDAEANEKITIRDLLAHRSGLNRTDLAMITGKLNREELIKVVGTAKPAAKLREKFLYQNIMYTAAGEATARANGVTWDKLIEDKIFKPLGMTRSTTTAAGMEKSNDFSFGYDYTAATKETRRLPLREIDAVAPAGSINSSAKDMANWLRFMLGNGEYDGKRLVSEKGMNEVMAEQMKIAGGIAYGLGWFLRDWQGKKVVEHGGNIDGFNAQVALMPEKKLGFVLLTNVTASPIGAEAMEAVWTNLVGKETASQTANLSASEVGKYKFAEAGFDIDVSIKDGMLVMNVPSQPTYPLERVEGRRFKLGSPAPAGFFITFRDAANDAKAYLEQPQGNFVLPKIKAAMNSATASVPASAAPSTATASVGDAPKTAIPVSSSNKSEELVGLYENSTLKATVEIVSKDAKVSIVVSGQPPYQLIENRRDDYNLSGLPASYKLIVKRDAAGKITAIETQQPQGNFEFMRVADFKPPISVEDLMAKVVAAAGGEANLRRHKTMIQRVEFDFENQGVKGFGTVTASAPNMARTSLKLIALDKEIGTIDEYFDGTQGAQVMSFSPVEHLSGKQLADARTKADFYSELNWRTLYQTIEIKKLDKVDDEEVYVVIKTPAEGNRITDYVSTKTFRVLRRDSLSSSATSEVTIPVSEIFSDFRIVDGVVLPFKSVTKTPSMGTLVTIVKNVKFDVVVEPSMFRLKQERAEAKAGN